MTRHLDLSVQAFVKNVPIDLMERYLTQLKVQHIHRDWLHCNADALEHILDDPKNAETGALIRADFQRLNDISNDAMGLLHSAFRKYGIRYDRDLPREHLAMLLFLDHSVAFDYVWSRFLLLDTSSKVSVFALETAHPEFGTRHKERFQASVRDWFADQAKGEYCDAQFFDDAGETLIRVQRGTYMYTRHYWDGPQVGTQSYRPAAEDVLVFEPDTKLLRIKAGQEKEREQYLRLFCEHILGIPGLADAALHTEVFSLTPAQSGTFDYGGDGPIVGVELRWIRLRQYGVTNAVLELKAEEVRDALQYDLPGIALDGGVLLAARLRFRLAFPGQRGKSITVHIEPPLHTNLHERRYADHILRYLERQGVKLR